MPTSAKPCPVYTNGLQCYILTERVCETQEGSDKTLCKHLKVDCIG